AMGCQTKIAHQVRQKGADYLLAVKENQPKLADAFEAAFPMKVIANYVGDSFTTVEKNRGREESRYHVVSGVTEEFQELSYEWPDLKTVGVVVSFRQEGDEPPDETVVRYYISSAELTAEQMAKAVRQHWHIENRLHWCLDVAMREDACRIHRGHAAENLARVRHIAMNYLKGETKFKGGIRRKQKKAALSEEYL
ncbi:ISAs1 family transposase, partial [Halomonas sp. PBN3]|uniref:ISAs1 family transposase n=1 Tax=Halomonas sp. PBN3 TaxID=1397528 RepID=UPI0012695135